MDLELDAGFTPGSADDLAHCIGGERCLSLAEEYVSGVRVVPLQPTQDAQLQSAQRMDRRDAVLTSRDVQEPLLQVYLIPAQADQFRYPQAVAIGDQDQGGIPPAVTADTPGSLHQRRHLLFGKVFPASIGGIRLTQRNFPFYDGWLC